MSIFGIFVLVLLALLFIYVFFKGIYDLIFEIVDFFYGDVIHLYFLRKPLEPQYKSVIAQNFSYYNQLKPDKKDLFERKVQRFIDSKMFKTGHDLDELHTDMIALVSATAIQVTFGFPRVYLKHFKIIYMFYDAYHSEHTGHYHYGEVNHKGSIVLSWKNFVFGLHDETDGRNLGVHEMAHALKIENSIRNKEYGFLNHSALMNFIGEGRWEMHRMRKGQSNFFREYATLNDHEFFAVAMECFFEQPKEFKSHNAKLYSYMCKILNQDPLKLSI